MEAWEGGGMSRFQEGAGEVEVEMCRRNTGLEGIRRVSHVFQVKWSERERQHFKASSLRCLKLLAP